MPYHILLLVEREYEVKRNSWLYTFYYNLKSIFIHHYHDIFTKIYIDTVETEKEAVYETFNYLVTHKYSGLDIDSLLDGVQHGYYGIQEEIFLNQAYLDYDDSNDIDSYFESKFIDFLVNQTHSIKEIHTTCLKYCDESYDKDWKLEFEFTE